jgi:hypothetical protein
VLLRAGAEEDSRVRSSRHAFADADTERPEKELRRPIFRHSSYSGISREIVELLAASHDSLQMICHPLCPFQMTPVLRVMLYARGDYPEGLERLLADEPGLVDHANEARVKNLFDGGLSVSSEEGRFVPPVKATSPGLLCIHRIQRRMGGRCFTLQHKLGT